MNQDGVRTAGVVGQPTESAGYHWSLFAICTGVLLLGVFLQLDGRTGVRLPGESIPLPEICLTKRMFHQDCPGCGLTRSVISTMRGDLRGAYAFHPVGPLMFLLIAAQIPYRLVAIWRLRSNRDAPYVPGGFMMLGFVLGAMIVQWIVRIGFAMFAS